LHRRARCKSSCQHIPLRGLSVGRSSGAAYSIKAYGQYGWRR